MDEPRTLRTDNLTPRQVAEALGVSESSLKRWCDRGLIRTTSTPGGHRRLPLHAVLDFLRTQEQTLLRPELLGLPADVGRMRHSWEVALIRFRQALADGEEYIARQVVIDTFLRGHPCSEIGDRLISPAMHWLGERWECGELEVYRERRSCRICLAIVHELEGMITPRPEGAPIAIGGTPHGDLYEVATSWIRLLLREQGWQASSLGSSLPQSTLLAAIRDLRPKLFWLSVSHLADAAAFPAQLCELASAMAEVNGQIVVGGRQYPRELQIPGVLVVQSFEELLQLVKR